MIACIFNDRKMSEMLFNLLLNSMNMAFVSANQPAATMKKRGTTVSIVIGYQIKKPHHHYSNEALF
jgi:hypothetical protein